MTQTNSTVLSRRGFLRGHFRADPEVEAPVVHTESVEPLPGGDPGPEALPMPWERGPRPTGPQRPARPGGFVIAADKCLAHRGQACSVCRERCPVPGAIAVERGQPRIVADICDGCGVCVATCPAPILAIRFQGVRP